MIIIQKPSDLHTHLARKRQSGSVTGFVPTMGALHEGHLNLVRQSLDRSAYTVCSIFVNPTQFNDPADFNKYPKQTAEDVHLLERTGANVLYLPSPESVYGERFEKLEQYDLGYLESILEGRYRPGHFQGVCQVMSRLLKSVEPDLLFMGRKDYQQCLVVRHLLDILNLNTELIVCDTVRDNDGLALSSRNLRLTKEERQRAPDIYRSLQLAKNRLEKGSLAALKKDAVESLTKKGFRVDYFEIASTDDLQLLEEWNGTAPVIALVAAYLGNVRLIDNLTLYE